MIIKEKLTTLFKTGFFHIFGGSVLNKIISFLTTIVLARVLSKKEYGVFTYAWNIYSIVLLFNGLGIENGILQLSSEKNDDKKFINQLYDYGTKKGLLFDVCIAFVLFLIGAFVPLKIEGARRLFFLLILLPMFQLLFNISSIYLRSQKLNKSYAVFSTSNTFLLFLSCTILSYCLRANGLVLGYYLAYFISLIIAFFVFKIKLFTDSEKLNDSDIKGLWSISLVSMCNNGLSQMMYLLDVFVLGIVDPNEIVLASYKVATIIPSALTFIPLSLMIYVYPYFAEHRMNQEWCMSHYKKLLSGITLLNIVISMLLFAFAPLVIRLIFGAKYLDAVLVFRILAINYFISGTFRIISGNLLVTQRKLKFNLIVAIVSGLLNVILDYLFISWWGSVGAALATVCVVVISSILSTTYLLLTFKGKTRIIE